jgi:hypothetical protein
VCACATVELQREEEGLVFTAASRAVLAATGDSKHVKGLGCVDEGDGEAILTGCRRFGRRGAGEGWGPGLHGAPQMKSLDR